MKTKIIFTVVVCVIGFRLFAATSNPQVITALPTPDINVAADVISAGDDSATIGAIMPYLVNTDPFYKQRPTLFNPSNFNWIWSGGAASIAKIGGAAVAATDTIIQITMPATIGTQSVNVSETSMPKIGSGCTGTPDSKNVIVVDKPTLVLNQNDTIGGCSAIDNNIKVTLSGNGNYYISYDITAYDFASPHNVIGATKSYFAKLSVGMDLLIYADQLAETAGLPAAPSGEYRVVVTGLWDGISVRALNKATAAIAVDPAATNDLSIFVYPTPQKPTIKFLKRL
jgi:hypothetical protein